MADSATNPSVEVSALRVQALQRKSGEVAMVKLYPGRELYNQLRRLYLPLSNFDFLRMTESGPVQVSGTLTKVTYTPTEHSIYRVPLELTYHRYPISVLRDLVLVPPAGGWGTVEAFRLAINDLGFRIYPEDLDLTRSVVRPNGTVTLYPSKTSWLFSPDGSYDSSTLPLITDVLPTLTTQDYDYTPKLHLAIVSSELSGFNKVGGS